MLDTQRQTRPAVTPFRLADFPAIGKLVFLEDELNALTSQGFVCEERRRGKVYYKLRYRLRGKQRVRYVCSTELAQAIDAELAVLQQNVRLRRQLVALARAGSRQLRDAKQKLQPLLNARGFHFHGQTVRRQLSPVSRA